MPPTLHFVLLHLLTLTTVRSLDNGVGRTPPMGYSSWNDCASQVTEERIKNITTHLIQSGLAAKGYIHVNVDEGWLLARNSTTGQLIEDRTKFPSGMKALGAWIHNQTVPGHGQIMKYGLYTSRGTCQCATQQYSGPGGHGHEALDAAWIAEAGADYLKVDSCCGSPDHSTAFADYGRWRDGLNATGRPIYLSLCGWYTWYAPMGNALGNSWRIAGDGTNWGALSNCINLNAQLTAYSSPGAWNDPDLLQGTGVGSNDKTTNPSGCFDRALIPQANDWYQTEVQSRAQFSMWCIMSAPLLISADVGQVSQYSLATWGNAKAIQVSQTFRQGGPYQGERLVGGVLNFTKSSGGNTKDTGAGHNVWGKLLPGEDFALVFVSNENNPINITCDATCFGKMHVVENAKYLVRDLWSEGETGGRFEQTIASPFTFTADNVPIHGGVAMYRFTPQQQPPTPAQCAATGMQCAGTYFKTLACCDGDAVCTVTGRDGYSQCITK